MASIYIVRAEGVWRARYKSGTRVLWSRSLKTKSEREAEIIVGSWRAQLEVAINQSLLSGVAFDETAWAPAELKIEPKASFKPLAHIRREFLGEIERLHQGQTKTIVAEKSRVAAVFDSLAELKVVALGDVDYGMALASMGIWSRAGRSPKTIREYLRMARWIFDHAQALGLCKENPFRMAGVRGPKVVAEPKAFWTMEEIDRIIEQSPETYKAFWGVMAYAGLRLTEAMTLEWPDVQFGSSPSILVRMGKGGKSERVPMGPKLQALMVEAKKLSKGKLCFDCLVRKQQNVGKQLVRCCRGLEFEQKGALNPHRFRHSFASHLVRKGVDITRVKELMRHSSIKDTMVYAHLRPSDLDHAVGDL